MLNDVLAVCVGAALIVVFATIFGAVELLWEVLAGAVSGAAVSS
jgi:Flp pilus assembly pilin Flp